MNVHNIFCLHLHTRPGRGIGELEEIFNYSPGYKKLKFTIPHHRDVENYLLEKLGEIDSKAGSFNKKDMIKVLRILRSRGYINEEQGEDIITICEGRTPNRKIEVEKEESVKPKKPAESFGHELTEDEKDYEQAAVIEAEEKDLQGRRDQDFERYKRDEELRKMSENI